MRQWHVRCGAAPAGGPQAEDTVATVAATVNANTAQEALRVLVVTTTNNARVTSIHVQLADDDGADGDPADIPY
jgi:hypothetical protein